MTDLLDRLTNIRKFRAALEAYAALVRDTREAAAACGYTLLADPTVPSRPAVLIDNRTGNSFGYATLHELLKVWTFVSG